MFSEIHKRSLRHAYIIKTVLLKFGKTNIYLNNDNLQQG